MPITTASPRASRPDPHYARADKNVPIWECRTPTPSEADRKATLAEIFGGGHDYIIEILPSSVCGINLPSAQGRGGKTIVANPGDMVAYPALTDDLAHVVRSHSRKMMRVHYSKRVGDEALKNIQDSSPPVR